MTDRLKLQLKRTIKASPAELFAAWTQPELMKKWYAPGTMTVPVAVSDLRVGGSYRLEMADGPEQRHVAVGTYKQIIPNKLLAFTWNSDCSTDTSAETLVTIEFTEVAGGTELVLTHEGFTDVETRDKHEHGWNGCLDNLNQLAAIVPVLM
ncbi:MAG: SRPBCC domain-containing protein [Bacillota bacterium]|nr:SRPBCC domain-containing protein [Bacillota bacterium]